MCGLFGQVNSSTRHFDYRTFCSLGVMNDTRGGDSCGIFIDGNSEYGIDKKKYFQSFMCDSKLLKNTSKCRIAFGHSRKTSVGATTLETAQPVIIREDGKVKFVLMHNGTIYNYDDLAKKYIPDVDIRGMSDTQIMANIFYRCGYDVLTEYNGSAVFVIADYRNLKTDEPKIFMFKGESKLNSGVLEEERPLWFVRSKCDSIFFSSLWGILMPINKNSDVCTLESNWLYQIKNQSFRKIKKYDRSEQFQTKQYNYGYGYGSSNNNNNTLARVYGDVYGDKPDTNELTYLPAPYNRMLCLEDVEFVPEFVKWDTIEADENWHYYITRTNKLLHGGFKITDYGYLTDGSVSFAEKYWFWQGVLLKNEKCFNFLEDARVDFNITIGTFTEAFPELVNYLGLLPEKIGNHVFDNDSSLNKVKDSIISRRIEIPFTKRIYEVEDGKIKSTTTLVKINQPRFNYFDRQYDPNTDKVIKDYC